MIRELDLVALTALALGVAHVRRHFHGAGERDARRVALQTWEAEGGAVPVSRSSTVAQVSPAPDAARTTGR
jgi:hypothetical protein